MSAYSVTARALARRTLYAFATSTAALWAAAVAPADDSLARAVPAQVGLFFELRQADDLLIPLVEPQLWLTLAELAGQPAALTETEEWRRRVEQTVNMSPVEAVHTLFSQRVAFVSEGLRSTQDAVILCRPSGDTRQLIQRWQARPLPTAGRTSVYRLPNHVGLGVHKDVFVFGDHTTRGLFDQILRQLEGGSAAALADDPVFQRLLARVPADPDGLFFARLTGPPLASAPAATAPAASRLTTRPDSRPAQPLPQLPLPLRGSANVLLALHRDNRLLHISAVGDAAGSAPPPDGSLAQLVAHLPQQTLLAWSGQVDYESLTHAILALPERSVFRVAYQLHERAGTIQRLTGALHSATCVAVGVVTPAGRRVPAPPIPAVGVLAATRDRAAAAREWSQLFHTTLDLYKLLSLKLATPPRVPPIERLKIADLDAEQLDLSSLVSASPAESPLGELHLSWAIDGDVLIIASHSDWLRQIIEARQGRAARLSAVLQLSRHPVSEREDTVCVAQTGPLADLGTAWLGYFENAAPQVLKEDWWRNYQPGGGSVRLGIQVIEDPEGQRLRIQSVTPNTPAAAILKPGDYITGCNRRRFATSQPVQEIKRGLALRPNVRWVDLDVERNRVVRVRRVALPFVDPVEILRRVIAIGQVLQRVVYFDEVPDAAGPRGYLTLELRTSQEPLFIWGTSPATSVPAAGRPIEALEDREVLDLEELFVSPHETFVLRVQGDSMVEDRICDGDYVVVEKRETARDGETVVALLDEGEATLKRFYRDPDGIRLQPANPKYAPIKTKNVRIQGVVAGVVRKY